MRAGILCAVLLGAVAARADETVAAQPAQELLKQTQIKATVDSHIADLKACLKENGAVTGKLVIRFGIMPNGRVIDSKTHEPSSNAALDKCVVAASRKWEFPKRDIKTPVQGVDYPFQFTIPKPQPVVDAKHEQALIEGTINGHMPDIKVCHDKALEQKSDAAGIVNVEITIAPAGPVVGVKRIDSTTKMDSLDNCIMTAVKKWQFPKLAGGANIVIVYPFKMNLAK